MLKRKPLIKILLLALLAVVLLATLTSCAGGNTAQTKENLSDWKSAKINNEITLNEQRGFIDYILYGIGIFIGWITSVMPAQSYILALFVFAIIVEILMLPFSIFQQKNSKKQAMLRPKEMAIRKKYAGRKDAATQQKISQEIQEMYQQENFNAAKGCLPLLLQIPIIMALYSIVVNPLKYVLGYGGNFSGFVIQYMNTSKDDGGLGMNVPENGTIGFIAQLREKGAGAFEGVRTFFDDPETGEAVYDHICKLAEKADKMNFNIGPINMGYIPTFNVEGNNMLYWLLLIPVLTFVVYFFSAKITRKFSYQATQGDANNPQVGCTNKMMDWTMPLMSVWMTFIVPAAVGIYWMFKSVMNMVKQIIISKAMPMPVFTEADYKAAEREYAGKQTKNETKVQYTTTGRSLHYIDEEDYDENGNYCPKVEDADYVEVTPEEPSKSKEPKKLPENRMTQGASLKDDSDRARKPEKKKSQKKKKK